jgi:hypothetical protein
MLSLAGVAAIAAIISYTHGLEVVREVGNVGLVAYLQPILADLVILSSSMALLDAARAGTRAPRMAVVALLTGIGVTMALNLASGWPHGVGAALVAVMAPVFFVLSLENFFAVVRRGNAVAQPPAPATERTAVYRLFDAADELLYVGMTCDFDQRIGTHARDKPWWPEVARTTCEWFTSRPDAALAEYTAITDENPRYNIVRWNQEPRPRPAQTVLNAARDAYADSVAAREPISERALAERFNISRRRAAAIRAEVAQQATAEPPAGTELSPPRHHTVPAGLNGSGNHG